MSGSADDDAWLASVVAEATSRERDAIYAFLREVATNLDTGRGDHQVAVRKALFDVAERIRGRAHHKPRAAR